MQRHVQVGGKNSRQQDDKAPSSQQAHCRKKNSHAPGNFGCPAYDVERMWTRRYGGIMDK